MPDSIPEMFSDRSQVVLAKVRRTPPYSLAGPLPRQTPVGVSDRINLTRLIRLVKLVALVHFGLDLAGFLLQLCKIIPVGC